MIFSAVNFALRDLAVKVVPVVPVNSARVVLQCFRVSVAPGHLEFAGTDTDQAIVASTPLVTAEGKCTFLIPAHKFTEVLQAALPGDVSVEVGDSAVTVRAGSSEWSLATKNGLGEYPALPDADTITWHETARVPLLDALKVVRHAVSRDRPALSCISVNRQGDGSAKVTAYDGARLQQALLPSFPFSVQVPTAGSPAAVDELARVLGGNANLETVQVGGEQGSKLFARAGSVLFVTGKHLARAVDADAELLAPTLASATQVLSVQRDALLSAIRRVRVSCDPETSAIGLRLTAKSAEVLSRDKHGNHAQEAVDATWEGKAGRLVVLNHRYLAEALSAHPATQCEFRLGADAAKSRSPVLLRDEATKVTAVLMQGHPKSLGTV